MQSKVEVIAAVAIRTSDGLIGELCLNRNNFNNGSEEDLMYLTLDLGDYSMGRATAASVKEKSVFDRHTRIHMKDVPRMLESIFFLHSGIRSSNISTQLLLHCHWKKDLTWGNYLHIECDQMPSRVDVYSGGQLHLVGNWIKIHFLDSNNNNTPRLSYSSICLTIMMVYHHHHHHHHHHCGFYSTKLQQMSSKESVFQMIHDEDLLRYILSFAFF